MPTIYNPNKRKGLFFIPSGAIKSESAAFSYSQDSYRVDESNPTPTITGETGGTFTATPEGLTLNSSTGEITLSSSVINSYVVTYTLPSGTFESRNLGIEAAAFASTRSFSFDGVNDYFSAPNTFLNSASVCTLSFWMKGTGEVGGGAPWNGLQIQAGATTTSFRTMNGSNVNNYVSFSPGTDWHHYLGVYVGGSYSELYIDGVLKSTLSTGIPSTLASTSGDIFKIGYGQSYSLAEIDEVAVWNSALNSAAVTEIYNSGVPNDLDELTNASDPTVWYRCGE